MSSKNLVYIDYLRAIASITVAVAHIYGAFFYNTYTNTNNTIAKLFLELIFTGGFGVSIFFLISGFIIPLSFSNIRTFLIRRVFRIYPAFLIAAIIFLYISGGHFQKELIYSYTLLIADLVNSPSILAGVDWTLRIEVSFYLYVGLLMWKNKLNCKSVLITAILLLVANIIIKIFNIAITPRPFIYFYLFLLGILFYLKHTHKIPKQYVKKINIIVLSLFFVTFEIFELAPYNQYSYPFLAISVFYLFLRYQHKFINYRIVTFFSNCSYPLYLLHNVLFQTLIKSFGFITNQYIIHLAAWIVLLMCCYLMHIFVEKPFISLGKKFP